MTPILPKSPDGRITVTVPSQLFPTKKTCCELAGAAKDEVAACTLGNAESIAIADNVRQNRGHFYFEFSSIMLRIIIYIFVFIPCCVHSQAVF